MALSRFTATSAAILTLCGCYCCAGGASPARAAGPTDQYLIVRRQFPPTPGLNLAALAQQPELYRGQTLELQGKLLGVARAASGASLILKTADNQSLTLQMSLLPDWVQPGERLRVLIVVAGEEGMTTVGLPHLEVVALASATDVTAAELRWQETQKRLEQERIQLAAARRSSGGASRKMAALPSRGKSSRAAAMGGFANVYTAYRNFIQQRNSRLSIAQADTITAAILNFSQQMDVDPRLVIALIIAESDFNPNSTSSAGAMGLGQLMPGTARDVGLTNPYDPVQNIAGAVYVLKGHLHKYSGGKSSTELTSLDRILALAAYNAGPGAVKKYNGVPPYRETQRYVRQVESIYRQLCGEGA